MGPRARIAKFSQDGKIMIGDQVLLKQRTLVGQIIGLEEPYALVKFPNGYELYKHLGELVFIAPILGKAKRVVVAVKIVQPVFGYDGFPLLRQFGNKKIGVTK